MESKGKKILIADDEPDILEIIQYNLTKEGYEVITAKDGDEAIGKAKIVRPDLIILDIMMPKKNGFDVCNAVKNELGMSHIHIILLTAKGQEFDRQRGQEVGADLYLTKPFDPDALIAKARSVLGLSSTGD